MHAKFTTSTPWGPAHTYRNLGQGVFAVSTAGHGGIFVPVELLGNISPEGRADAKRWSGSEQWFEEDCCWAHVAVALPDRFQPDDVELAKRINKSRGFNAN